LAVFCSARRALWGKHRCVAARSCERVSQNFFVSDGLLLRSEWRGRTNRPEPEPLPTDCEGGKTGGGTPPRSSPSPEPAFGHATWRQLDRVAIPKKREPNGKNRLAVRRRKFQNGQVWASVGHRGRDWAGTRRWGGDRGGRITCRTTLISSLFHLVFYFFFFFVLSATGLYFVRRVPTNPPRASPDFMQQGEADKHRCRGCACHSISRSEARRTRGLRR